MTDTSLASQNLHLNRCQIPIGDELLIQKVKKQFQPDEMIWNKVAIVVGLFLLAAGIFGVIGLVHTYHEFLPTSWATKVITFLANTPHHWSLWTFAADGVFFGTGLTALISYKIHQQRMRESEDAEDWTIIPPEVFSDSYPSDNDFSALLGSDNFFDQQ